MGKKKALIVVDVQNDFCRGGALAVPRGDEVMPIINSLMSIFPLVIATKDWHPVDHCSFKEYGGMWPPHCVRGTDGARLHPGINQEEISIFVKGFRSNEDSYSGFGGFLYWGDEERGPAISVYSLESFLRDTGIKSIFVTGLATDYCVKATVLDGLKLGFEVYVVADSVAAVNVDPGDGERALKEMEQAGAKIITSKEV